MERNSLHIAQMRRLTWLGHILSIEETPGKGQALGKTVGNTSKRTRYWVKEEETSGRGQDIGKEDKTPGRGQDIL